MKSKQRASAKTKGFLLRLASGICPVFRPSAVAKVEVCEHGSKQGIVSYADDDGKIWFGNAAKRWKKVDIKAFDSKDRLLWSLTDYPAKGEKLEKTKA